MRFLLLFFLPLSCLAQLGPGGEAIFKAVAQQQGSPVGGASTTPTLVQHVSTFINYNGELGSPYYINLPNTVGSGNLLILCISYKKKASDSVTITDDKSNTWTAGPSTAAATAAIQSQMYYATNCVSGTSRITITFNNTHTYFNANATEFYNVALFQPFDGSNKTATATAPNLSVGSFTTGTSGDLIYCYALDNANNALVTNAVPGSGFSLLSAEAELGIISEYKIQTSAGAINPSLTCSGTEVYNMLGMAFKPAAAGTAPDPTAMRVVTVFHTFYGISAPAIKNIQLPSRGNLLFVNAAVSSGAQKMTNITSNPSNTWTPLTNDTGASQMWFATNATSANTLTLIPQISATTLVLYDVVNASPYPIDVLAVQNRTSHSKTNLLNMPDITPTTANGMIMVIMQNGSGPTTNMVDTTQIMDSITYGGQVDADTMENADGYTHYYNPSASLVSFGWRMNCSTIPQDSGAIAACFKKAP